MVLVLEPYFGSFGSVRQPRCMDAGWREVFPTWRKPIWETLPFCTSLLSSLGYRLEGFGRMAVWLVEAASLHYYRRIGFRRTGVYAVGALGLSVGQY